MKASAVYLAHSRVLVASLLGTKNGTWIPWEKVIEVPQLSSEVGKVVVDMLSHSSDEHDPPGNDPRRRTLLERMGRPDWKSFYVGVAMIVVEATDDRATITATVFDASGVPQPLGVEVTCPARAMELGNAILDVADRIGRTMSTSAARSSADDQHQASRLTPFGRKMAWLAIRSDDPKRVADLLQVRTKRLVPWEAGIQDAYEHGKTFITAPVGEWTLAIGMPMPGSTWPSFQGWLTQVLSHFPEFHYYATQRVVDYHAWARAVDRQWDRIFIYAGDVVASHGAVTLDEITLGLFQSQGKGMNSGSAPLLRDPTEPDVLALARAWSVDPQAVVPSHSVGATGFSGEISCFT